MKVLLSAADPAFAELYFKWRQDEKMRKFNPLLPSTLDMLRDRLAKACSNFSEFTQAESFFWFMELDSKKVGHLSMHNIDKLMLTAEIGYGVDPLVRTRGIATEALRQVAEDAFRKTPLRKLIAYVHEKNFASIRVLEKAGFKQEGFLREHYIVNGIPTNELVYGLLRHEFAGSNSTKITQPTSNHEAEPKASAEN